MLLGKGKKTTYPHSLFVGYAPFENPRFAVANVIEHGMSGAFAIPLGKSVLNKAVDLLL
jgi:penicillin-binding protein 2